jgi:hypothetical protein
VLAVWMAGCEGTHPARIVDPKINTESMNTVLHIFADLRPASCISLLKMDKKFGPPNGLDHLPPVLARRQNHLSTKTGKVPTRTSADCEASP